MKFKKILRFLLDLVSFNTPQARVINISSIFIILAALPTELLKYSPAKCVFRNFLLPLIYKGNCPTSGLFANCEVFSCGITRGMSRLLHGDLVGALDFNWLVIPVFFVMLFILIKDGIASYRFYKKNKRLL